MKSLRWKINRGNSNRYKTWHRRRETVRTCLLSLLSAAGIHPWIVSPSCLIRLGGVWTNLRTLLHLEGVGSEKQNTFVFTIMLCINTDLFLMQQFLSTLQKKIPCPLNLCLAGTVSVSAERANVRGHKFRLYLFNIRVLPRTLLNPLRCNSTPLSYLHCGDLWLWWFSPAPSPLTALHSPAAS